MFKKDARQAFDDARFSGMRLRDALCALHALAGLCQNFVTISIADAADKAVEIRTGQIKEYMVYGCVVKKRVEENFKRTESNAQ